MLIILMVDIRLTFRFMIPKNAPDIHITVWIRLSKFHEDLIESLLFTKCREKIALNMEKTTELKAT